VKHPFLLAAPALLGLSALAAVGVATALALPARGDARRLAALIDEAADDTRPLARLAVEVLTVGGHAAAARGLGLELLRVRPEAPEHGRRWLERAALQGDALAAYALARSLRSGDGGPRELERAVPYLEQAAASGLAPAHFLLGNAYRDGEGVPADPARALAHDQAAAEREDPTALQTLLQAYRLGELGVQPDPERAEALMRELEHAVHEQRPLL